MHGYEIRRRLHDELGLFANISFGSLYPALSRLERRVGSTVAAAGTAAGTDPVHRLAERRARRPADPSGGGQSRHQAVAQGVPDHRRGPGPVRTAARGRGAGRRRRRPELRTAPRVRPPPGPVPRLALLERRRAQLTRRLATDLVRASGERLDVYTRSLVEHSTEATEHDIAWLDRLIDAERLRQAPGRTIRRTRTTPISTTPGPGAP